jgi:hypothetical protein
MRLLDLNEYPGQSYMEREDGELSIPAEYTTAAHKLLSWPSIRDLLYPREDYLMKLEEQRGLICVYSGGEGDDTIEDRISPAMLPSLNSSSECDDTHADQASPGNLWAYSAHRSGFPRKLEERGVDKPGILWANPDTIRRYHRSYLKHIYYFTPSSTRVT